MLLFTEAHNSKNPMRNTPQKQNNTTDYPDLREELRKSNEEIATLKKKLSALSEKYERVVHTLSKIEGLAKENLEECQ